MDYHGIAALSYFAAAVAAALGMSQGSMRSTRVAVWLLGLGAVVHTVALASLHFRAEKPSLAALPVVLSLVTWIGVVAFSLFLARGRLAGLSVLVAPAASVATLFAAQQTTGLRVAEPGTPAGWSHLHVLLSAAGMGLLGVAGGAGLLYVLQHRRLKSKRPSQGSILPSLESLDRVNAVAISLGFLLLSLGVATGFLWFRASAGRLWPLELHAGATLFAWAIYAVLLCARFGAGQGGHRSAQGAVVGFALLVLAWAGAEAIG